MTYNPWHHLRSLGTTVVFGVHRLPFGRGWFCPDIPGIVLDDRLTRVERRVVLAHEIAHLEAGDTQCAGCGPGTARIARRRETAADAVAAERLIDLDALLDANLWSRHPAEVAEELDVDLDTLKVRVKNLTQDEKDYVNGRLATREDVA